MPESCDEMAASCCTGADIGGAIVIDDCGSAICSVSALLRFFHIPLNATCPDLSTVYLTLRETFDWTLSGNSADVDDDCYREPGETAQWGYTDTITTADPYCEPMSTSRETFGDQLQGNCANLTYDHGDVLLEESLTATQWYRKWQKTASNGLVTLTTVRILELGDEIDLNALLADLAAMSGAGLEDGVIKSIVLGCGGVPATTRAATSEIDLVGRSVAATSASDVGARRVSLQATSIKGLAARPYKLVETSFAYCPNAQSVECENFLKDDGVVTAQVDCLTIIPAVNTMIQIGSGAC